MVTKEGDAGVVIYGPYRELSPGSYEVEFHIIPHTMDNRTCCLVDVLRRGKIVTTEKDFTAVELIHRNGIIPLRFEVVETDIFEFRLTSTGTCGLTARYQRPLRLLSAFAEDPNTDQ